MHRDTHIIYISRIVSFLLPLMGGYNGKLAKKTSCGREEDTCRNLLSFSNTDVGEAYLMHAHLLRLVGLLLGCFGGWTFMFTDINTAPSLTYHTFCRQNGSASF